jgi:D-glycero-D-manno-heptose 1,7-bisphosphate phosphatase
VAQVGGRIDAIFFCPHAADSTCDCRKPRPGLLREIAARYNADLAGTPAIGDGLRDLQAAVAVGAQPILVLTGQGETTRLDPRVPAQTLIYPSLAAAVTHLTE